MYILQSIHVTLKKNKVTRHCQYKLNTSSETNSTTIQGVKFFRKDSCVQSQWNPGTRTEYENVVPANPPLNETYGASVEIVSSYEYSLATKQ